MAREDWATQDMAAKLLTAVIENRPKKYSAFANGMLIGDTIAPSVAAAYGGPDPAEPVSTSHAHWGLRKHPQPLPLVVTLKTFEMF